MGNSQFSSYAFVVFDPNDNVMTARVNQATFADVFATVTFDGDTGAADVKENQTVLFSRTSNRRDAYLVTYARSSTPVSGQTLNIGQVSSDIQDNDYIFVLKDTRLQRKRGRVENGAIKLNWDETDYAIPPLIRDLPTAAYAPYSNGSASYSATPNAVAGEAGAAIASWSWDADGGTASPNDTTQNVTLTYTTPGIYKPRLTVTDDGGRVSFFELTLIADDDILSNTATYGVTDVQLNATNQNGFDAQVTKINDDNDPLDETQTVIIGKDGTGDMAVRFVGRLRNESATNTTDLRSGVTKRTTFQVEGILTQLARISTERWGFQDNANASIFPEVTNLTIWRACAFMATRFYTLNNLHSITFSATDNTYRLGELPASTGNVLDVFNELLHRINGQVSMDANGALSFKRQARYLSSADRNALSLKASLTTHEYKGFTISRDQQQPIGQVQGAGVSWQTATSNYTVVAATSPAASFGNGDREESLNSQILQTNLSISDAQTELAQRTANHRAAINPTYTLESELFGSIYPLLIPNDFEWWTHAVSVTDNNRTLSFTNAERWLLESASVSWDNTRGAVRCNGTWRLETQSTDAKGTTAVAQETAQTVTAAPPVPGNGPSLDDPNLFTGDNPTDDNTSPVDDESRDEVNNPDSANEPDAPLDDSEAAQNGRLLVIANSGGVWITKDLGLTYREISPTSSGIQDIKRNPFNRGMYVLSNDGTDTTTVWSTDNVEDSPPTWSSVSISDELYTLLRTTDTADEVYIICPSSGNAWTHTFQFDTASGSDPNVTYGDGGFAVQNNRGEYSSGVGFIANTDGSGSANSIQMRKDFEESNITSITTNYNFVRGQVVGAVGDSTRYDCRLIGSIVFNASKDDTTGSYAYTVAPNQALDSIDFRSRASIDDATPPPSPLGSVTVTSMVVSGTGINPFASSSFVLSRRSTDGAATFSTAVQVSASPGAVVGADTQVTGDDIYVGSGQIYKATDGGAYAEISGGAISGGVRALYSFGQNAESYVYGILSTTGLFKVVSGGAATDITPNDGADGAVVNPNSITMSHTSDDKIWVFMNFGGTYKLAYTTNQGTSWSIVTGVINSGTNGGIQTQRNHANANRVYFVQGDTLYYTNDGGANWNTRTGPASSLYLIDVWG